MSERFESEQCISSFGGQFYIVCPQCSRCATVVVRGTNRIVLTCRFCGHVRDDTRRTGAIAIARSFTILREGDIGIGLPVDWYFHIPLWLQAPCCGEVLWAYNEDHLAFLEAFVAARQRTSVRDEYGWNNRSLMNRLPLWMKQAKNRGEVLRCLTKLREKLIDYEREILR